MVHPAATAISPPIENMSGVKRRRSWMPQGIGVSLAISDVCYCGFVIHLPSFYWSLYIIPLRCRVLRFWRTENSEPVAYN